MGRGEGSALVFRVVAECNTTRARVGEMVLPHSTVDTPVFMPVGTQGTLKGLLPMQLVGLDCRIMLSNTYHLGNRPGVEVLEAAGGLHKFMGWPRSILTDSGGFQMVSLLKLAEITEEGVNFESPYDGSKCMLTPERSIEIQRSIGADIMMQLDDVVDATHEDPARFEEARHRTVRWLDRCLSAHPRPDLQNLFPIVQGGLEEDKRRDCAQQLMKRDVPGFAVGGLSGGEAKEQFWRMVAVSASSLPSTAPRYLMGVGHQVDLVVCCALGIDMFDCVYPSRTARFGSALVFDGPGELNLKKKSFAFDFSPLDPECLCSTCTGGYTRAFLHTVVTKEPSACHLVTVHNIAHQLELMRRVRESIVKDAFPQFLQDFFQRMFPGGDPPSWAREALASVGVTLA